MTAVSILLLSAAVATDTPVDGVLLDFGTPACVWCRRMDPLVSRLKQAGHPIRKVDATREPGLARRFGVTSYPTFVVVINGRAVDRIVGATSEQELRRLLAKIPRQTAVSQQPRHKQAPADRRASTPQPPPVPVSLANGQSGGSSGFQIPFLGRRRGKKEVDVESPFARVDVPVVRAKLDGKDESGTPSGSASAGHRSVSATVRIRVQDGAGIDFGSGTVIYSRPGRALVLTCGHLFRHLESDSMILIDLFGENGTESYRGRLVDHDLKAEVGLIAVPIKSIVPTASVAGVRTRYAPQERVVTVGCSGGEQPTPQLQRITSINRYIGPDNIECTGIPVQGRSGGGLFNADEELIGVCFAANSDDERGLYAGLKAVHNLLDRVNLRQLYEGGGPRQQSEPSRLEVAEAAGAARERDNPFTAGGEDYAGSFPQTSETRREMADAERVKSQDSAIRQVAQDLGGDVEVICIIRPKNKPRSSSRVVIINQASTKFLSYLSGETLRDRGEPRQQAAARP